jgi:hypothetical protein
MKLALSNGQRQEAQPGLSGECPACKSTMVAKCGETRVWHWAHKGRLHCDPWWENETPWHRGWKDQFPLAWQEIIHQAEDGERHIADVRTHDGWALEFQHSAISPEERQSREAFYQSLIWVVDGMRRKRDLKQFASAWASGETPNPLSSMRRITSPKGALLRDWAGCGAHVFFDFRDGRSLWWLYHGSDEARAYINHFSRSQFVRIHKEKHTLGSSEFESLVQNFSAFIAHYESPPPTRRPRKLAGAPPPQNQRVMMRRKFRL